MKPEHLRIRIEIYPWRVIVSARKKGHNASIEL